MPDRASRGHAFHRPLVGPADFAPFQAVGGRDVVRWAGGFGGEPGRTGHLEVMSHIDGVEVTVDTSSWSRRIDVALQRSLIVHDLIGSFTLEQTSIEFPFTVTVVADDRSLRVEGEPVLFRGARIDGATRWVGSGYHEGLVIHVSVESPAEFMIRRCDDWDSLPEHGPASA